MIINHSISKLLAWACLFLPLTLSQACRKSDFNLEMIETISDQGGGTGDAIWTSDKEYLLNGFVFVNSGQTLVIEEGCVIRARTGQGSLASALIVARGGTIIAEGSQKNPIIFTVENDDLEGSVPLEAKGLWGGLIILGSAPINTESGEDMIEGIPISEPRAIYGGQNENANSGILRYVSIRHGGTNIGEGNEINGLTLGGVGRKTIIENVEVIANADDGVEFFGGTVNCRNLAVSFCGDDAFDLDQGYQGKGQFWLGINGNDRCLEISGGMQALPALPGNQPCMHNATLIGDPLQTVRPAIHFSEYGGGYLSNSIILDPGKGAVIQYSELPGDSWSLFESGRLALFNNIFFPKSTSEQILNTYDDFGSELIGENKLLADSALSWGNTMEDPGISGQAGTIQLLPPKMEFDNLAPYASAWFERVPYKGAFGSNLWIEGWTLLYESGRISD